MNISRVFDSQRKQHSKYWTGIGKSGSQEEVCDLDMTRGFSSHKVRANLDVKGAHHDGKQPSHF